MRRERISNASLTPIITWAPAFLVFMSGFDVTDPESFDIERPAAFYLGREYDLAGGSVRADQPPIMYDARDLLTHGVVVGMTGSGKTGLCITLLEEAAIDGIPCII